MSAFDTIMGENALPIAFEQLGRSATYTTKAGVATAITAIVGRERVSEDPDDNGIAEERVRGVTIMADPASEFGGVASPALNDSITIGSEVWEVRLIESRTSSAVKLTVVLKPIQEISRGGYRRGGS